MRVLILLTLFFLSCKKTTQEAVVNQQEKSEMSVVKEHKTIEPILQTFKEDVSEWQALGNLELFLNRFKKASANQILSNAVELETLSKALRDTIKPETFNLPPVNARINILYNEALRLADMNTIPAITADEVHEQANKIIDSFSSINAKINTIFRKKNFEDAIEIDVSFIGLDTTKIDSVSRKSINKRLNEKEDDVIDLRKPKNNQ